MDAAPAGAHRERCDRHREEPGEARLPPTSASNGCPGARSCRDPVVGFSLLLTCGQRGAWSSA